MVVSTWGSLLENKLADRRLNYSHMLALHLYPSLYCLTTATIRCADFFEIKLNSATQVSALIKCKQDENNGTKCGDFLCGNNIV